MVKFLALSFHIEKYVLGNTQKCFNKPENFSDPQLEKTKDKS